LPAIDKKMQPVRAARQVRGLHPGRDTGGVEPPAKKNSLGRSFNLPAVALAALIAFAGARVQGAAAALEAIETLDIGLLLDEHSTELGCLAARSLALALERSTPAA
jgi:hypothetical protein